jgi:hypothetical protein
VTVLTRDDNLDNEQPVGKQIFHHWKLPEKKESQNQYRQNPSHKSLRKCLVSSAVAVEISPLKPSPQKFSSFSHGVYEFSASVSSARAMKNNLAQSAIHYSGGVGRTITNFAYDLRTFQFSSSQLDENSCEIFTSAARFKASNHRRAERT